MGEISSDTKIHVVRGTPWLDAIIALLQPDSPYRPWRGGSGVQTGDAVLVILDTEPAAVITTVPVVGADGLDGALARVMERESEWDGPPALLELGTLTALSGLSFSREGAEATVEHPDWLIERSGLDAEGVDRALYLNGHNSLAAARILLKSVGRCTGCGAGLDLADANARYHVHIHTVDVDPTAPLVPVAYEPPPPEVDEEVPYGPEAIQLLTDCWRPMRFPPDWPAVLCDSCHDRMRAGGFTSFLDFRFSLHPQCPSCFAQWTMRTTAGFIVKAIKEPWIQHTGCCPDQRWWCAACGHRWGGRDEPGVTER